MFPPCCTVQHSWPSVQSEVPQQNSPAGGCLFKLHGGGLHVEVPEVESQYGCAPPQVLPQLPQLSMSLAVLTQLPLQQVRPGPQPFGPHPAVLPPVPLPPVPLLQCQ